MPSTDWKPVFVLPNIRLEASIGDKRIAFAPADDQRVKAAVQREPRFGEFIRRFTDAFGDHVDPTVMLVRSDSPKRTLDITILAGFRDLVAQSVTAYARARVLASSHQGGVLFGNSFSFYPWMTDRNDEHLLARTPALLAIHTVNEFQGQAVPEVPTLRIANSDLDLPLFRGLMERWRGWALRRGGS